MIEWEVGDEQLRVAGPAGNEVRIRGEELTVDNLSSDGHDVADEGVTVTARSLRFPRAAVHVSARDRTRSYEVEPGGEPLSLPSDAYVVDVETAIETFLRFSGPATIERSDHETVVTYPERRRTTVGVRRGIDLPTETITVPPTPDGLAAALEYLAVAHETNGPGRSRPGLRSHPPLLELGDALEVPPTVRAKTPVSGIELLVPPDFESLFVTAPLAYYLGATVRTADCEPLTIRAPGVGLEYTPPTPLERSVERLLRTVFFLDCLVRPTRQDERPLAEASILDALELDPQPLRSASPVERLATALEIPYAALEHRLPDWHLATYVSPEPSTIETLPFLLDRLSLLFTPRTSELEGAELVERSLEDFYRAGARNVASVDVVKPELQDSLTHGWLADGVPIDVFKTTPEAYHNRLDHLERSSHSTSICVVINDPKMADEFAGVTAACRERANELSIELSIEESLGTAALARLFETDYDFLHYIGHCETDGLRCPDGHLSTASLDRSRVETFFLNACGSFYEGRTLIENGSVAGAVTVAPVLDDHALKVGSTFAKLLVHGFSIERALGLARRRIMMGKDYTVVGDGTHSLTRDGYRPSPTATVDPLEDGRFALTLECYSTLSTGSTYDPPVTDERYAYLCGTESTFVLERRELAASLERIEMPVVFDGDLDWSTDVGARLAADWTPA